MLDGKYIWIWELSRSEKGNIDKLVQQANSLGIKGYIIKTHDGTSFWQQSYAVQEFKNAGISCGAWGYCYGKNISGEIDVIKKVAALNPDFYVMDVEAEFEPSNMRAAAEQFLSGLQDVGVPLGYTSFAIPSLHTVPFEVFSKYCKFTMPQIYWAEMRWDVMNAFNQSVDEYNQFGIPVYPIGQITSDVAASDIEEFKTLCASENIPSFSFWNYQEAGSVQQSAIKEVAGGMPLSEAVNILVRNKIINSPDYWINNATNGKLVNGGFVSVVLIKMAQKLTNQAFKV